MRIADDIRKDEGGRMKKKTEPRTSQFFLFLPSSFSLLPFLSAAFQLQFNSRLERLPGDAADLPAVDEEGGCGGDARLDPLLDVRPDLGQRRRILGIEVGDAH